MKILATIAACLICLFAFSAWQYHHYKEHQLDKLLNGARELLAKHGFEAHGIRVKEHEGMDVSLYGVAPTVGVRNQIQGLIDGMWGLRALNKDNHIKVPGRFESRYEQVFSEDGEARSVVRVSGQLENRETAKDLVATLNGLESVDEVDSSALFDSWGMPHEFDDVVVSAGAKPDDSVAIKDKPAKAKDQPAKAKDEPAKAKDEPAKAKDEPAKAKDQPAKAKDEPAKAKDEPAKAKDEPAKAKDQPAKTKDEPAKAKDQPAKAKDQPAKAKDEPAKAKDEPAKAKDQPAKAKDEPAKAKDEPAKAKDDAAGAKGDVAGAKGDAKRTAGFYIDPTYLNTGTFKNLLVEFFKFPADRSALIATESGIECQGDATSAQLNSWRKLAGKLDGTADVEAFRAAAFAASQRDGSGDAEAPAKEFVLNAKKLNLFPSVYHLPEYRFESRLPAKDRYIVTEQLAENNIYFDLGSVEVTEAEKPKIDQLAKIIKDAGGKAWFVVGGHADASGNAKLNAEISRKRAERVRSLLAEKGIGSKRLELVGFGASEAGDQSTEEQRRQSRRVEVRLK